MYQLVVVNPISSSIWTEPNRQPGDVIWVNSPEAARHLIEQGLCKWPESIAKEVQGEAGPSERKSYGDRTVGPSTDSPSSNPRGPERLSSASAADLVLPERL